MQGSYLISIDQLKAAVVKDLESLLNSRCAIDRDMLAAFPEVANSLYTYGMPDFVGLSLASPGDRRRICRSLEDSLAIHEKRLTRINVSLEVAEGAANRIRFVINALLLVYPLVEPVFFDAHLQPSTLQYSCSYRSFVPAC